MAQVPYNPVASVEPDARPPDDYQHVEATPASFGGTIAQGAEKAGAGALDLSKYWGKVQAQDASNNAEKEAADLTTHVRSLQGQDALDAQAASLKSLDAIREKYRGQLQTPDAQSQFDQTVTPYFNRFVRGSLDSHFVDQGKVVASKVNTDTYNNAVSMATTAGSDGSSDPKDTTFWMKNVEVARAKAFMAAKTDAQQQGLWSTPEAQQAAEQKANVIYSSALEARALTKPDEAWAQLQDPKMKAKLGNDFDKTFKAVQETVTRSYVSRADAMAVDNPAGVEAFVRANAPKFGNSFGEALERAQRAKIEGGGKALAAQSDAAVGSSAGPRVTPAADAAEGNIFLRGKEKQAGTGKDISSAEATRIATGGAPTSAIQQASYSGDALYPAFHGQESGGGANTKTSIDNAHGDMQIIPSTFKAFAKPGEDINNPADNIAVGKRILNYYSQKYNGDAARVAVAYFSGEGNVAPPGSATPWKSNSHDGQGTYVSQYVNGILGRLGHPGIQSAAPPALGHGSFTADSDLARPGFDGAKPDDQPAAEGTPAATPAAFTTPASPPVPPQTPEQIQTAIYDQSARRLQWIDAQDATPQEKDAAKRQVEQDQAFLLAASAEKQSAIKAREDEAANDVLGTARKEGYASAYKKLNDFMSDPRRPLSEEKYDVINNVLERRSGNPNPISYGAKYSEALNNIVKPKDESQRISDPREIMRMEADGELTAKGADHLNAVLERMKKSTGEFGLQQRIAGITDYAKEYLDKSVNEPYMQVKDPEGRAKFDVEFLNMFHSELDTWRDAGKNVGDNPLLAPDHKALDLMLRTIRPRAKINEFQIQAGATQPFQAEAPNTPAPTAPPSLNSGAWGNLMGNLPRVGGQPLPHAIWGQVLTALAADPRPEVVASFNKYFGPGGFDGQKIAAELNSKAPIAPTATAAITSGMTPIEKQMHDSALAGERERSAREWATIKGATHTVLQGIRGLDIKNWSPEARSWWMGNVGVSK